MRKKFSKEHVLLLSRKADESAKKFYTERKTESGSHEKETYTEDLSLRFSIRHDSPNVTVENDRCEDEDEVRQMAVRMLHEADDEEVVFHLPEETDEAVEAALALEKEFEEHMNASRITLATGVQKILQTLLQTLHYNDERVIIQRDGRIVSTTSSVNPPLQEEDLLIFEKKIGVRLPVDHRSFLLAFNGAKIYQELLNGRNIGGGLELFPLDGIKENFGSTDFEQTRFLPIGSVEQRFLAIHLDAVESGNPNYLYLLEMEGPQPLNLNLMIFVDRFVVSNGSAFWEWPGITAANSRYSEE